MGYDPNQIKQKTTNNVQDMAPNKVKTKQCAEHGPTKSEKQTLLKIWVHEFPQQIINSKKQ